MKNKNQDVREVKKTDYDRAVARRENMKKDKSLRSNRKNEKAKNRRGNTSRLY